ncbi:MAG TPA: hypothetical protein VGK34_10380 [Armatimonadota bacterium]
MFTPLHFNKTKIKLLICPIILGSLLVSIGIAGCGGPEGKKPAPSAPAKKTALKKAQEKAAQKQTVNATFQSTQIIWSDNKGRPLWIANCSEATAEQTSAKAVAILKDVKAEMYKDGKLISKLTAPLVEADSRTKQVKAYGGVKVVSTQNGGTAVCREMLWKSQENKIMGSGNVKMTKENMTIVANSFVSDTALKSAKFSKASVSLK